MIEIVNGVETKLLDDLDIGDTFLHNGDLYIKANLECDVLNLSLQGADDNLRGDLEVMPVNIKIEIVR